MPREVRDHLKPTAKNREFTPLGKKRDGRKKTSGRECNKNRGDSRKRRAGPMDGGSRGDGTFSRKMAPQGR